MKNLIFTALVAFQLIYAYSTKPVFKDDKDWMKQFLDDMQEHFDGPGAKFNQTYYDELTTCMSKFDDEELLHGMKSAWKGIYSYWLTNGTKTGYYGGPDYWDNCCTVWQEDKLQERNYFGDVLIYEECDYASNVAYYHSVTKICDYPNWSFDNNTINGFKRTFAALGTGSAMMHGTHTHVGGTFDNQMISIIAYQAFQNTVYHIPGKSPVLAELSDTARNQTLEQIVQNITEMFYTLDVPLWAAVLDESDYPHDYKLTFGGFIAVSLSIVFPWRFTQGLITLLGDLVLSTESRDFIVEKFLPELKEGVKNVHIPILDKFRLFEKALGLVTKIVYAFLFQEQYIPIKFFLTEPAINWGGHHVKSMNNLADSLTQFPQTDYAVNMSENVYPGSNRCNFEQGHSIWHEVSANGLLDLIYFSDYIDKLFIKYSF